MLISILACTDPSPIPQSANPLPIEDTETVDVIIIGGGASGMAAARRLVEHGLTPIILEQQTSLGGSGLYAGRFFAVDTPWQANNGIEDSIDIALSEWTAQTQCVHHPALEDFLSESASMLNWIGAEYFNDVHYNRDVGWRIHPLNQSAGRPPLSIWAEELEAFSKVNTTAIQINQNDKGIYHVLTSEGERYSSANVVLATGGLGRNRTLIQEIFPSLTEDLWYSEAWPYAMGSGLDLIAPFTETDPFVSLHIHGVTDPILDQPEIMIVGALSKSLIVNQEGERLFNEEDFEQLHFGASQFSQNTFFALFDAPLWSNTAFKALSFNHPELANQAFTSNQYETSLTVHSAETWEELGSLIELPSAILDQTVQEYNEHIHNGLDPKGKNLDGVPAIGLPPFYALPLRYSTGRSFKGVQTNRNMQVCNDDDCLDGLYAVGEIQGLICASEGGYNGSITAAIYAGYAAANHIVSPE